MVTVYYGNISWFRTINTLNRGETIVSWLDENNITYERPHKNAYFLDSIGLFNEEDFIATKLRWVDDGT